ncbi:MAG: Inner membrane ABC transporter permease protein YcjO [Chroococcidiopsis cubana SAG 39.79]|jgi:sorbitol/mannitol transport system permease protein|uniref:ABC transporter permease n=1 Tax=Chroococcidiopsis cubana SAG 39.79 TaxID=388085 RepID=A0AB37UJA5_9CYAN|nr:MULTISPECIES: sugar ABC transporter permease [Chroococcidiopsis]MDZ4876270.1 Inner membrane ABC transporter permease protein YcjO [Chroococcidiopsis cubana SAG 39.79]PSB56372.1 sugar ABC transporter permease [Chroococcidiopsis cubana CCALA 043]RUT11466.1 ABC transporter permease [Chroococcidiopsis cubana SAG 39.79]URD49515.1 sugar ABC transporter permease [Chroococcidiopsis sp. CCNUC1]
MSSSLAVKPQQATPPPAKRSRRQTSTLPLVAPSVIVLLLWMIVPLAMTLWFSFQRYNLLNPDARRFIGIENFTFILTDPALWTAIATTLILVASVLAITIALGTLLAVLFDQDFPGRGIARVLAISPFFVMPTVSALIWKNMLMHPVNGLFAQITRGLGLGAIDWFADFPLLAIIIIVSWEWLPFALLILLTAIQSLDREQLEAARMDGANAIALFRFVMLPHLSRAIAVVAAIETIFFLTIFAEIFVTTGGGPGLATTNLAYYIFLKALLEFDVGGASAGGLIAVLLANIVAIFLMRSVARNLDT